MTRAFFLSALVTAAATVSSASGAFAQHYDIDCKVILCLPAGFPGGCGDAKSYMIKRLKKGKPPFGVCAGYNGSNPYYFRLYGNKCDRDDGLPRPFIQVISFDISGSRQYYAWKNPNTGNITDSYPKAPRRVCGPDYGGRDPNSLK